MKSRAKTVCIVLFCLYSLLMLWLLFGQRAPVMTCSNYSQTLRQNLNLVPGKTLRDLVVILQKTQNPALYRFAWINLFGNVVMFVPLGFFLPRLWPKLRRFDRFLAAAVVTVLVIELVQLLTLLGSCDVDDLLLNLPGTAIGYCIFHLTKKNG